MVNGVDVTDQVRAGSKTGALSGVEITGRVANGAVVESSNQFKAKSVGDNVTIRAGNAIEVEGSVGKNGKLNAGNGARASLI